jgi:hypothetical protein
MIRLAGVSDDGPGSQTCMTNIRLQVLGSVNRRPQILGAIGPRARVTPLELRPQ